MRRINIHGMSCSAKTGHPVRRGFSVPAQAAGILGRRLRGWRQL